jgi:hypothetical protein
MVYIGQLASGFSTQSPGFNPGRVMRLVIHTGALGQVSPRVFWFPIVSIIPPMLQRYAALIRSTSGRNLETFKKKSNVLSHIWDSWAEKYSN